MSAHIAQILAASTMLQAGPLPWDVRDGYVLDVVASDLMLPVNIAFVPDPGDGPDDPLCYITELYGTIKVVQNDGDVSDYATGLLNFNPTGDFPGSGEQGLTGIVVDPSNGDVIVTVLYDDGGPHYPKVSRYSSLDGGMTASQETILLDMAGESQGQSHQISNVSFGPDGMLYVHMGDGFFWPSAQDPDSFRGKILRLAPDGSAPTDNPFFDAGDGISASDYVFAMGVRNPFGGGWRASDGRHYNVENGPAIDRMTIIEAGVNYGWNGSNDSMFVEAIYNWSPAHAPTNILFVQPETFGGSGFPASMQDRAFVAESGPTWATGPQSRGKRISEFEIDASGQLVSGPTTFVEYTGEGKASVVGLAAGPDGMYFTDFYKDQDYASPIDRGSNLLRVRFVGAALFEASVTSGDAPLAVEFTDLSNAPGITSWAWSFGDGATSTLQHPTHVYQGDGVYDVTLEITSDNGTLVEEKNGYIRVGQFGRIAFIGGALPPSDADQAVGDRLGSLGYDVVWYDDEASNRPSAEAIADASDVVVISSTVLSGNIDDEFRALDVPVVFWEQALLAADRMAMATSGMTIADVDDLMILRNDHPVTASFDIGTLGVFSPPSVMSAALPDLGPGVTSLATRADNPLAHAILVADVGDDLLGGFEAPARRVFLFLEDDGALDTTSAGAGLVDRAVQWAIERPCAVDLTGDGVVDVFDVLEFLALFDSGDLRSDWNGDLTLDIFDVVAFLASLDEGC